MGKPRGYFFGIFGMAVFFVSLGVGPSANAACCRCTAPGTKDPKAVLCMKTTQTDCVGMPAKSGNADVKKLDCTASLNESQCRPLDDGVCALGPFDEGGFTSARLTEAPGTVEEEIVPADPPELGVPIPNLQFARGILPRGEYFEIPWLAQYISAIYIFLTGVSAVAAAIMIMWGGFRYIVGSTAAQVSGGKSIIIDAVTGLLIVLGAFTILATINPDTVTLQAIRVLRIDPLDIGMYNPTVPLALDPGAPPSIKATSRKANDPLVQQIIRGAKAAGVDPCLMLANCEHESRLNAVWNGQHAGNPKAKAFGFGACGNTVNNLRGNGPYYNELRSRFPDFPILPTERGHKLTPEEKLKIGDWLLTNHEGDAYAAATIFKEGLRFADGNEILAVAAFKAGSLSMKKWRDANRCTPQSRLTFKQGLQNHENALKVSCVPPVVAIPTVGDPPKGCPEDGGTCQDVKASKTSEWIGHCKDGRMCKAMKTDDSVRYILAAYPRMITQFQCDK